ncbi:unnamed protein product [Bursaphelenchus xylophilus]|uniref:(pine wood nematode) hypothetical protein n=1 Tax=Bursaphelenchus xylophilus TaxID=6326 RepID=A0A1I7RMU2_BURXY|nr:unnamed protein product [Bursaphelenchus xylophilus]CAG9125467.1 unnamed protein product [Bursaphelenchus xylophilus]
MPIESNEPIKKIKSADKVRTSQKFASKSKTSHTGTNVSSAGSNSDLTSNSIPGDDGGHVDAVPLLPEVAVRDERARWDWKQWFKFICVHVCCVIITFALIVVAFTLAFIMYKNLYLDK